MTKAMSLNCKFQILFEIQAKVQRSTRKFAYSNFIRLYLLKENINQMVRIFKSGRFSQTFGGSFAGKTQLVVNRAVSTEIIK